MLPGRQFERGETQPLREVVPLTQVGLGLRRGRGDLPEYAENAESQCGDIGVVPIFPLPLALSGLVMCDNRSSECHISGCVGAGFEVRLVTENVIHHTATSGGGLETEIIIRRQRENLPPLV